MPTSANDALRLAQRVIIDRADSMPHIESGYQHFSEDPRARGMRDAARMLDALIQPERAAQVEASAPSLLGEIEAEIARARAAAEATGDMDARLYAVALRGWAMRVEAQGGRS